MFDKWNKFDPNSIKKKRKLLYSKLELIIEKAADAYK